MRMVNAQTNMTQEWRNAAGELHRDGDLPARILPSGTIEWRINGLLHRGDDKPAVIWANGDQSWYEYGVRKRGGNKPTRVNADGSLFWYVGLGLLYRPGGKSALICASGMQLRDIFGARTYMTVTWPAVRLAFIRFVLQT